MKILHTADLHLGRGWKGRVRKSDQDRVLDEIVALCRAHAVELLLVAGDVFEDHLPESRMTHEDLARGLLEKLMPLLRDGVAVCLLRGNHDPWPLFQLLGFMASEIAGTDRLPLIVAEWPDIYRIPGREDALQIIALPYLDKRRLLDAPPDPDAPQDAQNADLSARLATLAKQIYAQASPNVPAIFTAHYTVGSPQIRPDTVLETGYIRDLALQRDWLPGITSYNALGHIHLQQEVMHAEKPTWYAGAPDRMDAGERAYTPGVLLVTTPDAPGGRAEVEVVPLQSCTPWVENDVIDTNAALHAFRERWRDRDPLGTVRIGAFAGTPLSVVEQAIRETAPRLEVLRLQPEAEAVSSGFGSLDVNDVRGIFEAYLREKHATDAALRERLQRALDELLAGEAVAS